MEIQVLSAFILSSMILCFSPGPTVFLVMAQALTHGKKSTFPLVLGALSGDLISLSLAFIGMGVLLSTSATLFNMLKWAGALYLIYLGIRTFRTKTKCQIKETKIKKDSIFFNILIVTALNPKGIIFFTAFFPLFINADKPVFSQMVILGTAFMTVSAISVSFYTFFSGLLRSKIKSVKFQNWFNKISGGMLVSAGVVTATIQKNS